MGKDAAFAVDVAALRAVRAETGVGFHRIMACTSVDLDIYLRRERHHGRPVRWLHLAVHADDQGVEFVDGVVSGDWLSERLAGVEVLFIAGCNSDRIADWLPAIAHVVSYDGELDNDDAMLLTRHFWTGIIKGLGASEALSTALERCPPYVGESVIRHW